MRRAIFLIALTATAQDYDRFLKFADALRPLTPGIVNEIRWSPNTNKFIYTRTTPTGLEYILTDSTGAKQPAFDPTRLTLKNLTNLEINDDTLKFQSNNARYELNLKTYALKPIPSTPWSGGPTVPERTTPVTNPDKTTELFLQNYNLWLRPKSNPTQATPLTTDGSEGNYYTLSNNAWSPDGQFIAAYRVRPGQRRKIHYVQSSPSTQVQPLTKDYPYAKPGDALDIPQPVLINLTNKTKTDIPNHLFPNPFSLSPITWRKQSFTFEYNQRGHQLYRIIEVDANTAIPRALITEESKTFFCYSSKKFREDINNGEEIIWMSERDGWNHLYLYDGKTGAVKNQITKGQWPVRSVAGVDAKNRKIYFLASGMDQGKDPYYRHLFRIDFDGANLTRLTTIDADHNAQIAPDFQTFTDSYSRPDLPPTTELRSLPANDRIALLEQASDTALKAAGWRPPEVITSKARDGQTDIWGLLYRPANFDPNKKYPVVEYIYAGPHDSFVPKRFTPASQMQALADLGFIVVQIDGMGTSNRSKAFHDVAWKNLADAGFPDRKIWHKTVAAKYPWYDLTRLGIYGHSAGGQSAMGALLFHNDLYKVAVSSAGCHDNRMDKIWWNEQWMGWPVGPEYAKSSNVDNAPKLKGNLLLAVGELDTNVDPSSTFQVVNALIKSNKDFDLLVLPNADHGGWGPYWDRKRATFLHRHLN